MRTIRQEGMPKRVPVSLRLSPPVHDALLAAARGNGTSLTTEAENCIRRGLDQAQDFGGGRALAFFRGLASEVTAYYGDDSWLSDPVKFDRVREHIIRGLRATQVFAPPTEGPGLYVEMALKRFANTGDRRYLDFARDEIEDPDYPADWRAPSLARLAEVEANPEILRDRSMTVRVYEDGRPLEVVPDDDAGLPSPDRTD